MPALKDEYSAAASPLSGDSFDEDLFTLVPHDEYLRSDYVKPVELPLQSAKKQSRFKPESADEIELAAEITSVKMPSLRQVPVEHAKRAAQPTLLSFHGLKQQPFDVTPDPSYLYFSPSHREALTSLSDGIENFRGFMALVAEPGMGKTTVLNKLMDEIGGSARVVFLFQTQCTSNELLAFLLNELEVDHGGKDIVAMHRALNRVLLEEMLAGRRFVLVVDEAQNLQDSVLETIRLLSDFETTHSKLIQIVLAGQPQLAETLLRPSLAQLRQRISVLSSLKALTLEETRAYVEHRLREAGWGGRLLFTPEAVDAIAEASGGVPRTINNLGFNALRKAYTRRQEVIDANLVREIAGNLNLESLARPAEPVAVAPAVVVAPAPEPTSFTEDSVTERVLQALSAAFAGELRSHADPITAASESAPAPESGTVLAGKLNQKVRCQSWSEKHESRIEINLDRGPISGTPIAERYYACHFYIRDEEASNLKVGKPIRIRIEQD